MGAAVGVLVVVAGVAIGLRPLGDNSFLTHLATGRVILETGAVPSSDPYTFTAQGEPWVVQSWLMSVVYATAERLGGLDGVRVVSAALAALVTALGWALLRPADAVLGRLAVAAVFLAVGAGLWSERPLMVGLAGFGLVALAGEGRLDPRWLLLVGWIWANSHGSYPLGLVYLVIAGAGTRLDGRPWRQEARSVGWLSVGIVAGMVGPLGANVLTFPVELLQQQELLSNVIEWRAPTFDDFSQRAFIVQLMAAMALMVRRPSYRAAVIAAVFTATALLGARNVAVASLALLPAMAPGLRGLGSLSSHARPPLARPLGALAVVMAVVLAAVRLQQPSLALDRYPADVVAFLEDHDVDLAAHRMAAPDYAGNFLEYVYGPGRRVFYDDRFDMFPERISDANLALVNATPSLRHELDALEIDLLALPGDGANAQVLLADPAWRSLFVDETWVLLCRRGSELGTELSRC